MNVMVRRAGQAGKQLSQRCQSVDAGPEESRVSDWAVAEDVVVLGEKVAVLKERRPKE